MSNHRGAAAAFLNESAATILMSKTTVAAMTGGFVNDDGGDCQFWERSKDELNHNVQITRLVSRVEHLKARRKLLVVKYTKKMDVVIENLPRKNKGLVTHHKKEAKFAKVDALLVICSSTTFPSIIISPSFIVCFSSYSFSSLLSNNQNFHKLEIKSKDKELLTSNSTHYKTTRDLEYSNTNGPRQRRDKGTKIVTSVIGSVTFQGVQYFK
jgi:hypothetical protein